MNKYPSGLESAKKMKIGHAGRLPRYFLCASLLVGSLFGGSGCDFKDFDKNNLKNNNEQVEPVKKKVTPENKNFRINQAESKALIAEIPEILRKNVGVPFEYENLSPAEYQKKMCKALDNAEKKRHDAAVALSKANKEIAVLEEKGRLIKIKIDAAVKSLYGLEYQAILGESNTNNEYSEKSSGSSYGAAGGAAVVFPIVVPAIGGHVGGSSDQKNGKSQSRTTTSEKTYRMQQFLFAQLNRLQQDAYELNVRFAELDAIRTHSKAIIIAVDRVEFKLRLSLETYADYSQANSIIEAQEKIIEFTDAKDVIQLDSYSGTNPYFLRIDKARLTEVFETGKGDYFVVSSSWMFSPEDTVYVAKTGNNEISVFNFEGKNPKTKYMDLLAFKTRYCDGSIPEEVGALSTIYMESLKRWQL